MQSRRDCSRWRIARHRRSSFACCGMPDRTHLANEGRTAPTDEAKPQGTTGTPTGEHVRVNPNIVCTHLDLIRGAPSVRLPACLVCFAPTTGTKQTRQTP